MAEPATTLTDDRRTCGGGVVAGNTKRDRDCISDAANLAFDCSWQITRAMKIASYMDTVRFLAEKQHGRAAQRATQG